MGSQTVRVRVPGKVNLHLAVGALRADGYHDVVTVLHAVDVFDEVTATAADGLSLSVSGSTDGVPTDERNLAWRAATALASAAGLEPRVALHIDKSIPVAGGMAGGSADAAGALLACSRLWGVDVDLAPIAASLGSDVVFALHGGTALGTGRGEIVEPVPCVARLYWVFAPSTPGISAADAYRELDRLRPEPVAANPAPLLAALAAGDAYAAAKLLHNDLQPAALSLRPELADTLHEGRDASGGVVSGSGPTCAFLCADEMHAFINASYLRSRGYAAVQATGPAPGATVID